MNDQTIGRYVQIGTTRIAADASMLHLSAEELRERLKHAYPEVAHATLRETTLDDGSELIQQRLLKAPFSFRQSIQTG